MRYRFDRFEVDTEQFVLRDDGSPVHVEPLVFDALCFLLERAGQVVTRDALVERVWKGRFVSDATIASCFKSLRQALGDSGEQQRYVRTVRGRGFQLSATVDRVAPPASPAPRPAEGGTPALAASAPPRIAVLPLTALSHAPRVGLLGNALAQEVIHELSRLHSLQVIARASSFQFHGPDVDLTRAGAMLGAGYLLTGTIMQQGRRCLIAVELCRAEDASIVWGEGFAVAAEELMHVRSSLAGRIVAALEPRIQLAEAVRVSNVPTEHLDAWAAYHRGLWHMYRFNRHDNERAAGLFTHAVRLDPGFARAHAGLSFTHFQDAFLGYSPDTADARRQAARDAERSLGLDPLDPFINLTMGRSEWLLGNLEAAMPWFERSTALSPNYAFALYNGALVGTMLGDGERNAAQVDKAMLLSPLDPLTYAMLATRALTHIVRDDCATAAEWAERAARSPNAHVQIHVIAALTNELIGNRDKAERHVAHIRGSCPAYDRSAFMTSFPFRDGAILDRIEGSLRRLGF